MIDPLLSDLRGSDLWARVEAHFETLFAPGFGRPGEPSDPAISADGHTLACTVLVRADLSTAPRQCVLIVGPDGDRLVEAPGGSVRTPRFLSPGSDLAVLHDRDGTGLVQPALVVDGVLMPLPPVDGVTEQVICSPDGRHLLALVADPGADAAGAQGSGRTSRADAPPWLPVVMADVPVGGWRRLWRLTVGDPAWHPVSASGVTCWEAAWAGPGRIVAVVSDRPDEAAWFSARLVEIGVDGEERLLLAPKDRCIGLPAVSPDGRRSAIVTATCSDRTVVAGDVTLVDLHSGDTRQLPIAAIDVTWLTFSAPDTLVVAGQRGLDTVVASVDVVTGEAVELWSSAELTCGQRYPELAVSGAGIAMVVEGYRHPPELARLAGSGPEPVTSFRHAGHDAVLESAGDVHTVRWTAPDATEIEGLLTVPTSGGPHPLVTYVHGGPVWAWRSRWSMGYPYTLLLTRMGFAVFHPNPRGSSGRGEEFRAAVIGDLGGAEADDILCGIDALVAAGIADGARLGVFGGSHGGFMAAWLITVTDRFGAAVPYCPVTDWRSMRLTTNDMAAQDRLLGAQPWRDPLDGAGRVRTPTLVLTGSHDLITPPSQGLAFHRALAEQGVETGYVEYPLEGHGVRSFPAQIDFSARTLGWFEHHLAR